MHWWFRACPVKFGMKSVEYQCLIYRGIIIPIMRIQTQVRKRGILRRYRPKYVLSYDLLGLPLIKRQAFMRKLNLLRYFFNCFGYYFFE